MTANVETMAYVGDRGKPWWIGIEAGQAAEMAALGTIEAITEAAGLNWDVIQKNLLTVDGEPVTDRVANVRSTDGKVLGVVGKGYRPVQNAVAGNFAASLLETGEAVAETAGSIEGGKRIFYSLEIPGATIRVPGDDSDVRMFLLVTNGHDGSHALQAAVTPIRSVCENTLNAGLAQAKSTFKIYHRGGIDSKIEAAQQALGITFTYAKVFGETAAAMAMRGVVDAQVLDIFQKAWQFEPAGADRDTIDNHASTAAFANYLTSDTLTRGNAWGAFNAITEYIDHETDYRGGKTRSAADHRFGNLFGGTGQKRIQRAFDLLKV